MKGLLATVAAVALGILRLNAASILISDDPIHPITTPEIATGSVLINDGKIAAVGPTVQAPVDAQVIDGTGLHLYPGLINAATNVGLSEIESSRDSVDLDEVGPFNPEVRAEIAFNPSSEHIAVTRAAGITTVLTLPGSGERSFR